MAGPISIVILARECSFADWKHCHGSHGCHRERLSVKKTGTALACDVAKQVLGERLLREVRELRDAVHQEVFVVVPDALPEWHSTRRCDLGTLNQEVI